MVTPPPHRPTTTPGFMVTPPLDTDEMAVREMGRRLGLAVKATAEELLAEA